MTRVGRIGNLVGLVALCLSPTVFAQSGAASVTADTPPKGLTPDAWLAIQEAVKHAQYAADTNADGKLVAANPAQKYGSPDIKVGRSPGRSDQELCDLGRNRLIHGFFWDLPEQYFLASVDGRLRRPRSGWGACSAAAKSRRKVFNLWLLLDDRWAGDTAQVEPVR